MNLNAKVVTIMISLTFISCFSSRASDFSCLENLDNYKSETINQIVKTIVSDESILKELSPEVTQEILFVESLSPQEKEEYYLNNNAARVLYSIAKFLVEIAPPAYKTATPSLHDFDIDALTGRMKPSSPSINPWTIPSYPRNPSSPFAGDPGRPRTLSY